MRAYLAASRKNHVVLPDYAENRVNAAGSDNVVKSTSILADFFKQVVGKQTNALANLRGGVREPSASRTVSIASCQSRLD
jgi:hypothetical protein